MEELKRVFEWMVENGYPLECTWRKEKRWPCEHCKGLVAFSEAHPDHLFSQLMLI